MLHKYAAFAFRDACKNCRFYTCKIADISDMCDELNEILTTLQTAEMFRYLRININTDRLNFAN